MNWLRNPRLASEEKYFPFLGVPFEDLEFKIKVLKL